GAFVLSGRSDVVRVGDVSVLSVGRLPCPLPLPLVVVLALVSTHVADSASFSWCVWGRLCLAASSFAYADCRMAQSGLHDTCFPLQLAHLGSGLGLLPFSSHVLES